jgi:hypothetical protein
VLGVVPPAQEIYRLHEQLACVGESTPGLGEEAQVHQANAFADGIAQRAKDLQGFTQVRFRRRGIIETNRDAAKAAKGVGNAGQVIHTAAER